MSPSGWASFPGQCGHLPSGAGPGVRNCTVVSPGACYYQEFTFHFIGPASSPLLSPVFFPYTISWDNPFIYAFFYSANAYEVRESYTLLVSALYLKSQEKCDVIYRHVVIDTDESFFFFLFDVGHFKNLEFVTILLPFYVLFFFGLQACGILAPEQGCNLYTLCGKVKS